MSTLQQFPQNIDIRMVRVRNYSNLRLPRDWQIQHSQQFCLYLSTIHMINDIYINGHRNSLRHTNTQITQLLETLDYIVDYNRNNRIGTPPIYPIRTYVKIKRQKPQEPNEITKVISKKKLEETCPEECSICRDTPKNKDSICTECNHYFCKPCWSSWINAERSNKSCPNCRKDMPKITSFRARVSKKRVVDVESLNTELDAVPTSLP
jgi:hypothetical protein